jgi:hypothetical protein
LAKTAPSSDRLAALLPCGHHDHWKTDDGLADDLKEYPTGQYKYLNCRCPTPTEALSQGWPAMFLASLG